MGLGATMLCLWVLEYPYCHQMISQTHPKGDKIVEGKNRIFANFQVPLNNCNNGKSVAFKGPWPRLHGPSGH